MKEIKRKQAHKKYKKPKSHAHCKQTNKHRHTDRHTHIDICMYLCNYLIQMQIISIH